MSFSLLRPLAKAFANPSTRAFQRHFRLMPYCCSNDVPIKQRPEDEPNIESESVLVNLNNGHRSRFHYTWLRHHCQCEMCINPKTKQRTVDVSLIPHPLNPADVKVQSNKFQIIWDDGHETKFDLSWLEENAYDSHKSNNDKFGGILEDEDMCLWDRDFIASNPPKEFHYKDIIEGNETAHYDVLSTLVRYGFVFINDTPTNEEATLDIGKTLIGPIRETPEGRVYVIENKEILKDTDLSHFSNALDGHTDYTFYNDPPGFQCMHCFHHHGTGGMSLLVDGFKAAQILFQEDPESFKVLSSYPVCFEHTYYSLEARGRIIGLDPFTKMLSSIRWNSSRLAPLTKLDLSFEEMGKLYNALRTFGSILRDEKNELWFKLTPGKVLLCDNRRVLHGRSAIEGPRKLVGYYISTDDYLAKWKEKKEKTLQRLNANM